MNGDEIRKIRQGLGLSQTQFAEKLRLRGHDISRTIRNWESGRAPVTGPASVAIEALAAGFDPRPFADDQI